jgi:hypothetical protein
MVRFSRKSPKIIPQELKPMLILGICGTAEAVPFQSCRFLNMGDVAEAVAFQGCEFLSMDDEAVAPGYLPRGGASVAFIAQTRRMRASRVGM